MLVSFNKYTLYSAQNSCRLKPRQLIYKPAAPGQGDRIAYGALRQPLTEIVYSGRWKFFLKSAED
jgi:hypothetical protein